MRGECLCELFAVGRAVGGEIVTIVGTEQIELRVPRQTLVALDRRIDIRKRRQRIAQMRIEKHHAVCLRQIIQIGGDARNNFFRSLASSRTVLRDILIKRHKRRARAVAEDDQLCDRRQGRRRLNLFEVFESRLDAWGVLLVTVVTILAAVEDAVGAECCIAP